MPSRSTAVYKIIVQRDENNGREKAGTRYEHERQHGKDHKGRLQPAPEALLPVSAHSVCSRHAWLIPCSICLCVYYDAEDAGKVDYEK